MDKMAPEHKTSDNGIIFNGFEYNDWGICLNPDVPYIFGKWNQHHFKIEVFETPRGWLYGYRWGSATKGGCGGNYVGIVNAFPTKSKAIIAAAEYIKSCYSGDPKAAKVIKELDRIISEESEYKPKHNL